MDTCEAIIAHLRLPGSWGEEGISQERLTVDTHESQPQMRKYHPGATQALRGQHQAGLKPHFGSSSLTEMNVNKSLLPVAPSLQPAEMEWDEQQEHDGMMVGAAALR